MNTFDAIFTRRSIRKYTPQPVPEELVAELLKAAMAAPSAGKAKSTRRSANSRKPSA